MFYLNMVDYPKFVYYFHFIITVGVIDLLKRLEVKKALTNTGDERGRIQLVTLGCEFSLCKQMPVCVTTYG